MNGLYRLFPALLLVSMLSGCFFVSTFQEPRVLDADEYAIQLGVSGIAQPGENGGVTAPFIPELSYRRGLGGNTDIGVRLGVGMVGADVKYQLLNGPLDAAVGLGGSVFGTFTQDSEDTAVLGLYPVLLIGTDRVYAGYRHIFLTGTVEFWEDETTFSQGVSTLVVGAVLGRRWQVLPEVAIYLPVEKGNQPLFVYGMGIRYRGGR